MSYLDFEEFRKLAPKCKFYITGGGRSEKQIKEAEESLNLKFSKQCREFYELYGYLSFEGTEIFGIYPSDSNVLTGNSVAFALYDRREYGLPEKWVPVYDFQDGSMVYLDYSFLNCEKEPRVILAYFNGEKYVELECVADDFGAFLLQLVKEQLERQEMPDRG